MPKQFCYLYFPFYDTTVTLEDERGEEYRTIFLGERRRLSGGWKRFCDAKKLVLGDLLVFHLVGPLKFKVCLSCCLSIIFCIADKHCLVLNTFQI